MSLIPKLVAAGLAAAVALFASAAMADPGTATASVNVRSGPGTSYRVVDTLYPGESVDIGRCAGGWCFVRHDGPNGWVSANYLTGDGGPVYDEPQYDEPIYVEPPIYRRAPVYLPPPVYLSPPIFITPGYPNYPNRPYRPHRPRPGQGYQPPMTTPTPSTPSTPPVINRPRPGNATNPCATRPNLPLCTDDAGRIHGWPQR